MVHSGPGPYPKPLMLKIQIFNAAMLLKLWNNFPKMAWLINYNRPVFSIKSEIPSDIEAKLFSAADLER